MGFGIGAKIGNVFIGFGRKIGRSLGYELAVVSSSHSLQAKLEPPDKSNRAWDPDLYRHGNLFVEGHANAIKPRVEYHKELENPNQVEVEKSDVKDEDTHTDIISSPRYREYMRQDLIEQLLNPREQWRLLAYGIIALGVLQFFTIIVTLYATGSF